jgi:hypothetical protein
MFVEAYAKAENGNVFKKYVNLLNCVSLSEVAPIGTIAPPGTKTALCMPSGHFYFSYKTVEEILESFDLEVI